MAVGENHFAPELNEKEVIELLENAKPVSIKKATNYGMKIFQGTNKAKQRKLRQFTYLEMYLYIVTSGFFAQNKVEKICLITWGAFNKRIIPLVLVGFEIIIAISALRASYSNY